MAARLATPWAARRRATGRTRFRRANYGRDCDSIASMAGAILGTLHGDTAIRPAWMARVDEANRVDLGALAAKLAQVVARLQRHDHAQATQRAVEFSTLVGGDTGASMETSTDPIAAGQP
jgi:hypothetical protein